MNYTYDFAGSCFGRPTIQPPAQYRGDRAWPGASLALLRERTGRPCVTVQVGARSLNGLGLATEDTLRVVGAVSLGVLLVGGLGAVMLLSRRGRSSGGSSSRVAKAKAHYRAADRGYGPKMRRARRRHPRRLYAGGR